MTFKPGKSGNPSGKRKDKMLSDALNVALKRMDKDDKTAAARIANKLVDQALVGELQAIRECWNRHEGMAMQAVTVAGDEDAPLQVIKRVVVDPRERNEDG